MKTLLQILLLFSFLSGNAQKDKPLKMPEKFENFVHIHDGIVYLSDSVKRTVNHFYMRETEVTNGEYRKFLNDLRVQGKMAEYDIAQIDSQRWNMNMTYYAPMGNYYQSHPVYNDYPVVNVSYEGAMLFCKWLKDKINSEENLKFKVYVRLPVKAEWIMAARAGNYFNSYSWNYPFLRDKKGKYQCNFKRLTTEYVQYDSLSNKYIINQSDILSYVFGPTPAKAFKPNAYKLYNMCGNVAEMLLNKGQAIGGSWNSPGFDVRVKSIIYYTEASPFVGFRPVISVVEDYKNR